MNKGRKKVTLWYKIIRNEQGDGTKKVFNHLEDGWSDRDFPIPKRKSFSNQAAWNKEKWEKENRYMSAYVVI